MQRIANRKLALLCLTAAVGAGIWYGYERIGGHLRHAEIAARGAQVMPFDLEQTTHLFNKTDHGGLQRVTANDPANATQVNLIQSHLRDESKKFQRGDFSSPAQIHGHDMPGLDALNKNYGQFDIRYAALADGAQIHYATDDRELMTAIHRWFDAQLNDHGKHATGH